MSSAEEKPPADLSRWEIPGGFRKDGVPYFGPSCSPESIANIEMGDVLEFDCLVATYARSGTARLLETCWHLLHGCDQMKSESLPIQSDRHIFLEFPKSIKALERPRVAKTHVDFSKARKLVERNKKVVVGIRNPKDMLVSYYHFYRMSTSAGFFPGNWHEFMDLYRRGDAAYGDYFDNVLSWWAERHRENILIVIFEEMSEEPFKVVKQISEFLGQQHSDEKLQALVDWVSFSNMSTQKSTNYTAEANRPIFKSEISPYMRKGSVGDWKNYFNDDENNYIDQLYESRCKPVGLTLKFE